MKFIVIFILVLSNAYSFTKVRLYCDNALLIESENVALEELMGFDSALKSNQMKYLSSVGLQGQYAFCAAAQYYCFAEACRRLSISSAKIPIVRSASVKRIFEESIKSGTSTLAPIARHTLLIWRNPKCSRGHIERLLFVLRNGWVRTLAFNTNCKGLSNSACIKLRNIYHPLGKMMLKGMIILSSRIYGASYGK